MLNLKSNGLYIKSTYSTICKTCKYVHSFGAIQIVEKKSKSYEKTYLVLLYMQVQIINVYADFLDTSVKRPDKSSHMGSLL